MAQSCNGNTMYPYQVTNVFYAVYAKIYDIYHGNLSFLLIIFQEQYAEH